MRFPAVSTILFWFIIVVIVMWIVKDPEQAAHLIRNIGGFIGQAAHALSVLASSL